MSDQQVKGTPCNLIPDLRVCYYQTVTSCVQGETLNSWQLMHHSELKRGLFCLVSFRPKLQKVVWTIPTMCMVAWASSVFGIPQSCWAHVNHVLLLSLSLFSLATLNWETFTQSRATFFQLLTLTGLAAIEKARQDLPMALLVPGDVGPMIH
jgi:hypothetical protein